MRDKAKFSKLKELVYELVVGKVMSKDVIPLSPNDRMSDLRQLLRDNRISGVPVVEGGRLLGIVSVEDFINWLAQGAEDCSISEKMSRGIKSVYQDEPLVHAISHFEQYGFGRLPVLDRKDNTLAGIVTKGDIIQGLLEKLDIDYHEEEIHSCRASHFLEDIIADRITLIFQYAIEDVDVTHGGKVASGLKKSLKRLEIYPASVRRAAIATYEAEMNVIIYADRGKVTVRIDPEKIRIQVQDKGEGIPDIEKALQPGFSTAPNWIRELGFGAGMGLNNIQSCAEDFSIHSEVGKGTFLDMCIPLK